VWECMSVAMIVGFVGVFGEVASGMGWCSL
jgi:hypothetical protein